MKLPSAMVPVACALVLAACGSSSQKPNTQSAHAARSIAYASCMRSHGVPNFPDPGTGGGIQLPNGLNPFSPAFKAAQTDCVKLSPFANANQKPSEQQVRQFVQEAQCMRAHGVAGFPDPTYKRPASPAGYSELEDDGGVILAIPSTINPESPAFQAAAKTCDFS